MQHPTPRDAKGYQSSPSSFQAKLLADECPTACHSSCKKPTILPGYNKGKVNEHLEPRDQATFSRSHSSQRGFFPPWPDFWASPASPLRYWCRVFTSLVGERTSRPEVLSPVHWQRSTPTAYLRVWTLDPDCGGWNPSCSPY